MNDGNTDELDSRNAAKRAALPFALLEELNIPCGYERSFKMLPGRLLANRYLLGVDLQNLTTEQLHSICRRLDMPEEFYSSMNEHLPNANLVFLGFEDNEPSGIYKIYLEFWDQVTSKVRSDPASVEPQLVHLGFKWTIADNSQRAVSRYLCYPLLSTTDILQRMAATFAGDEDNSTLQIATEIVAFAATRVADHSFIYMEVLEENSLRTSFDINLYPAMLPLNAIRPALTRLRDHFSIPGDAFGQLCHLTRNKLLGHLSGGISRDREEFLSIYYEN